MSGYLNVRLKNKKKYTLYGISNNYIQFNKKFVPFAQ